MEQLRDDMWSGRTSKNTSGPAEQEADEAELSNYLQYSQDTEASSSSTFNFSFISQCSVQ